jgi:hypothetical protein
MILTGDDLAAEVPPLQRQAPRGEEWGAIGEFSEPNTPTGRLSMTSELEEEGVAETVHFEPYGSYPDRSSQ